MRQRLPERYATSPFLGSNYGYVSGGNVTAGYRDAVERFSFTSDGGGTDVGNLSVGRYNCSGQSSSTHGYTSGGHPWCHGNVIDKFPFTSGFTTATDVGNLTGSRTAVAGQSSIPNGYGYNTGGGNVIDKFSFSSDGNSTTVAGNTLTTRSSVAGQSSATHGYTSGNYSPLTTDIDKFPFASEDDATDVGDLTLARGACCGTKFINSWLYFWRCHRARQPQPGRSHRQIYFRRQTVTQQILVICQ